VVTRDAQPIDEKDLNIKGEENESLFKFEKLKLWQIMDEHSPNLYDFHVPTLAYKAFPIGY
jgi:hypothetical protein